MRHTFAIFVTAIRFDATTAAFAAQDAPVTVSIPRLSMDLAVKLA